MSLLKPVVKKLGKLATLHIIEDADHSFHVPKSLGTDEDVIVAEITTTFDRWVTQT